MTGSISFQLIDGKFIETKTEYKQLPRGTPVLSISNIKIKKGGD